MSTVYQVTIQLESATLQSLLDNGYSLFAFQPIQATAQGQPVLWIQTAALAATISIQWPAAYAAYISESPIVVNGRILMSSEADIQLGQVMQVGPEGSFKVTDDGPPDAMSVLNTTTTQYSCGLAVKGGAGTGPIAAFPLYGSSMVAMAPLPKLFLLFESYPATSGQILDRTLAQGLLVDLSAATERQVSFDINAGWSAGSAPWATPFPANTRLSQILIHQAPLQLAESVARINAG